MICPGLTEPEYWMYGMEVDVSVFCKISLSKTHTPPLLERFLCA